MTLTRNLIVIILSFTVIFGCNPSINENYQPYGYWEILNKGESKSIFGLQNDSVELYRISKGKCDTTVWRDEMELKLAINKVNTSDFELTLTYEKDTMNAIMNFSTSDSGIICFNDSQCFSFRRNEYELPQERDSEEVLYRGLKQTFANKIEEPELAFKKLVIGLKLSPKASEIVTYIDSLRSSLLRHFNLQYESVNCWHRIDSIFAYKTPTQILIGEPWDPQTHHFSALSLKMKVNEYLKAKENVVDVKSIFPFFENGEIKSWNDETWDIGTFYHYPLGEIIAKLNELKLNIAKIERIENKHTLTTKTSLGTVFQQ